MRPSVRWQEAGALLIVALTLVAVPATVLAYRHGYLAPRATDATRTVDLVAKAPESGGWVPERIVVRQGDRLRLRIHGQDVVHGFAIGRTDVATEWIEPGKISEVEFVAETAGEFTFYCTVWCSPNHYRMRGTLEVVGPGGGSESRSAESDLNVALPAPDLDIDASHEARFFPSKEPSAARGSELWDVAGPHQLTLTDWEDLYSQSPSELFEMIRAGQSAFSAILDGRDLTDAQAWDLVAFLYARSTTPQITAQGEALYRQNCAACHGETGDGDGPGAQYTAKDVPDFTEARAMAGGTSQIYAAKIRRGGMGTGMPYYGPLFTEDEIQALVAYMWTFLYDYDL